MLSGFLNGKSAEKTAIKYLKSRKYKILATNYLTSVAEIDIICQKSKTVYFVEVKYRLSDAYGHSSEYVSPTKIQKIHRGSQVWINSTNWSGDIDYLACIVNSDNSIDLIELSI